MTYIIECKKGEYGQWFHSINEGTRDLFASKEEARAALAKNRQRYPHHDDGIDYRWRKVMSWDTFYKNGWILYCPECRDYVKQSNPQDYSGKKQVVIDCAPCDKCIIKHEEEVNEAQALMGRLGKPKGTGALDLADTASASRDAQIKKLKELK